MARYFGSSENPDKPRGGLVLGADQNKSPGALPIMVEIWDKDEVALEQVVALTSNRRIGWAAYFAAQEQYPLKTVILREGVTILGRWSAKRH